MANSVIHDLFHDTVNCAWREVYKMEMAAIEDILRHHIENPIEGELTREKVKRAGVRCVVLNGEVAADTKWEDGNLYVEVQSAFLGIAQGDWLIGPHGIRRMLTEKEEAYLSKLEQEEWMEEMGFKKESINKQITIMREIRFRAKTIKGGQWIEGDLFRAGTEPSDGEFAISYWDEEDGWMNESVRPGTIGEYIGLKDKNGREIYEGDILGIDGEKDRLEVRFVRGVFAFLWNGNLDDEFPTGSPTHEWAVVVGNIHDNPEMLKRK